MKKGLLLGAGFSYDLGMPLASELTEIFFSLFDDKSITVLISSMAVQQPFGIDRPINEKAIRSGLEALLDYKRKSSGNYEAFLADIQSLNAISNPTLSDRDSYAYLFSYFYGIIHSILCLYQEYSYNIVYSNSKNWFCNLEQLLSEDETWVFTLNHDLYFEYLALDFNVPITYGDDQKISFPISNLNSQKIDLTLTNREDIAIKNGGFFKGEKGVNLVKLHGGLSELEYSDQTVICNLRLDKSSSRELANDFNLLNQMAFYDNGKPAACGGQNIFITNQDGTLDVITRSILTGGKKYSTTSKIKKGEEKLLLFDNALSGLDELTVIGYGFGDEHINFRISNALLINPTLRVVIVDSVHRKTPDCIRQFDYDQRITIPVNFRAALWINYLKNQNADKEEMDGFEKNAILRNQVKLQVKNTLKAAFSKSLLNAVVTKLQSTLTKVMA